MKYKQEIFIFILLVFLIFSISVVSATESLDDTSNDELVLLSKNNELVDTMDVSADTVQGDDSADSNGTAETDENENGQNQKNVLGAANTEETPLRASGVVHASDYGYTFDSIRLAIAATSPGGTLYLDGAYYTHTKDYSQSIRIEKSITIIGGNETHPNAAATLDGANITRMFFSNDTDLDIKLCYLNLINGYASNTYTLASSNLKHSTVAGSAIGIHANSVSLLNINVDKCKFNTTENSSTGIVCIVAKNFIIENCSFTNFYGVAKNGVGDSLGAYGNGIIKNCRCINNTYYTTNPNDNIYPSAGGGLQAGTKEIEGYHVTIINCHVENNSLNAANHLGHGGGLCMVSTKGVTCINTTFINNKADQGGATMIHDSGSIENCTFINNAATTKWGGAISTGLDTPDVTVSIINCNFSGNQAPIGGGVQLKGNDIHIVNCSFDNNSAIQGGACYIQGQRAIIENSNFTDNKATHNLRSDVKPNSTVNGYSDEGGAVYIGKVSSTVTSDNAKILSSNFNSNNATNGAGVYIYGNNANITNSNFTDNYAIKGAGTYITGQSATLQDSNFDNNAATEGAGVYIKGNSAKISDSNFTGNNVSGKGGAVYIDGDQSKLVGNNFTKNNAIPPLDENGNPINNVDGLGGAIYVLGKTTSTSYTLTQSNIYQNNTARNGSAIYTDGNDFRVVNDKFYHNQAFSYLLMTAAVPEESPYNSSDVNVSVIHIGGDNILNGIYNAKKPTQIFLQSVSYINSTGGLSKTLDSQTRPVDGVEKSENGTLLYQDDCEAYQKIILEIYDPNGNLYRNITKITNIYGNVNVTLNKSSLIRGEYYVNATHPKDWNYKHINNFTTFRISGNVDLSTTKTSDKSQYLINSEVIWIITVHNADNATTATFVNLTDVLPTAFKYITSNASQGSYSNVTNNWTIRTLNPGQTVTLNITSKAIQTGTYTNYATVKSLEKDWNMDNNEANRTVKVFDLGDNKTVSNKTPYYGAEVDFNLTIYNGAEGVYNDNIYPNGGINNV